MSLRRYGVLGLFIALAACGNGRPDYAPLGDDAVVLAFGDSVTHGTGAGSGQDYPTQLAALTGWGIVNAGIPGDTASRAAARIADELAGTRPALAIIELGGNDFLERRSASAVKEDLRALIVAVRGIEAIPVLVSVPELSAFGALTGRLRDSPIYAELAAEEDVLLIDEVFAEVLSDDSLRADRIHPNAAGYRIIAERIADDLARAGLLGR
jgi:acyl-CoA hydrolase